MVARLIKAKKTIAFVKKIYLNCAESVLKIIESIENHFHISINRDDNAVHPEYMFQKCYWLMINSLKRETTIKLTPFRGLRSANYQICDKLKLLLDRTKANATIWTQSALETLKGVTQPDIKLWPSPLCL